MAAGDLLLMDDGAEFDGYSADVTRTIPVNGTVQRGAGRDLPPGVGGAAGRHPHGASGPLPVRRRRSMQAAVGEVLRRGPGEAGADDGRRQPAQLRVWFNHGISHGIGLNVHDPGGANFREGMASPWSRVMYFRPDALDNLPKTPENEKFIAAVRPAFERYKGIGVRIEDDVLITAGEPKVLSAGHSVQARRGRGDHRAAPRGAAAFPVAVDRCRSPVPGAAVCGYTGR